MSLSRQQLTLIGIFALFLGPVILVMLMRSSWWQYQPATLKNNGHLKGMRIGLALHLEAKTAVLAIACDVMKTFAPESATM